MGCFGGAAQSVEPDAESLAVPLVGGVVQLPPAASGAEPSAVPLVGGVVQLPPAAPGAKPPAVPLISGCDQLCLDSEHLGQCHRPLPPVHPASGDFDQ